MSDHIVTPKTYLVIFVLLLVLLVLTYGMAWVHTGEPWHLLISLAIAFAKAGLIAVFFMHLKYEVGIIRLFACLGLVWGTIAITLTLSDYLTRGWHEMEMPTVAYESIDTVEPPSEAQPTTGETDHSAPHQ